MKESFKKDDDGKARVELIEPEFILGMGHVLGFGAKKYADNNWKEATGKDIERLKGSMLRHVLEYAKGNVLDEDSGLPHLYHVACNAMFLDYLRKL